MPRARFAWSVVVVVFVHALLLARLGTPGARIGAVVAFGALAAVGLLVRLRERATDADASLVLSRIVAKAAPNEAERARRALCLVTNNDPGTSRALAELHVARTLAAIPSEEIVARARRIGRGLGVVTVIVTAVALGSCARSPFGVVEGGDVLLAREGKAPLDLVWLAEPDIGSRPPDYLHREEHHDTPGEELELPRGTLLTVRGKPVHVGRRLLLTDGKLEVPFVDDGSGAVVARFPLVDSVELRVVARFGDVVVEEPRRTKVTSIPDLPPVVELSTAPRRISLTKDADSTEIPIKYKAEDDHGLREVHLVLRAGVREERRVLSRLDGETKTDRGGHVLRATDPFFRRSHVPIEVRVAAKDNDPVTGPKWGESEAITVVPPDVGEPEALRLAALRAVRKGYIEVLAYRLSHGDKGQDPFEAAHVRERSEKNAERLAEALGERFAGLRISSRLGARLRLQEKKLLDAENREAKGGAADARKAALVANERMVLVVDAVIRGLGVKDSRDVAKELADAADDLALGAVQGRSPKDERTGAARMDAASLVVVAGGKQLEKLGQLGEDLGEIVEAGMLRVDRARKLPDLVHAELAAKDLALRLRTPDPSFGARGGSKGGDSSGQGSSTGEGDSGGANDAEQAFDDAAQDLERLASEHSEAMGKVDQALAQGATDDDKKALGEEAKKHAEAIRQSVKNMPSVGLGSDSWTSKGSAGKELAEQMARSLEEGNPADAVSSGRSAQAALEEAKRLAFRSFSRGESAEERLSEAQRKLGPELKWAEEKLAQMKHKAEERARGELSKQGEAEEKLADKAGDLAKKGNGAIPEAALEAIAKAEQAAREAAAALKQGDSEKGQAAQREAQQKLEAAKRALGSPDDSGANEQGGRGALDGNTPIPKADAHKGPEEFRKRVLRGLGQPGAGRQKDAVQRYAEGLLR